MKFHLVSRAPVLTWLARRLRAEGHDVLVTCQEGAAWPEGQGKDRVVLFDGPGWGIMAEALREEGYPVIGAGRFHDVVQSDSDYAQGLTSLAGAVSPQRYTFEDPDDLVGFLEERGEGRFELAVGLNGSSVAGDRALIGRLALQAARDGTFQGELRVTCLPAGPASWRGAWFNGQAFLHAPYVCASEPGFHAAAFTFRWVKNVVEYPEWFQKVLEPLTLSLRRVDYRGPIAVLMAGGQVLAWKTYIEAKSFAVLSLLIADLGAFLAQTASGFDGRPKMVRGFAVGIEMQAPPWTLPINGGWPLGGDPVWFLPLDVAEVDGEMVAGGGALFGLATGMAQRLWDAAEAAYANPMEALLPGVRYAHRAGLTARKALGEALGHARDATAAVVGP